MSCKITNYNSRNYTNFYRNNWNIDYNFPVQDAHWACNLRMTFCFNSTTYLLSSTNGTFKTFHWRNYTLSRYFLELFFFNRKEADQTFYPSSISERMQNLKKMLYKQIIYILFSINSNISRNIVRIVNPYLVNVKSPTRTTNIDLTLGSRHGLGGLDASQALLRLDHELEFCGHTPDFGWTEITNGKCSFEESCWG